MKAKVVLPGAIEFFQNDKDPIRIALGKSITIKMEDAPGGLEWAHTEDPVLKLTKLAGSADGAVPELEVKAEALGKSTLYLMTSLDSAAFRLYLDVFDSNVVSLNATVSEPRTKPA